MEDEVTAFLRKRSATRDQLYTEETFQLFEQEREETKKRGEARIERIIQDAKEVNRIRNAHIAKLAAEEEHYRTIITRICESNPYDGLPESLPEELWLVIFEYLSYRGLIAMTCVCQTFKRIGHDELVVCCACLCCVSSVTLPSHLFCLSYRIRYGGLNERGKKQGGSFGRDRGRRRRRKPQQRQHERGECLCTLSFIC